MKAFDLAERFIGIKEIPGNNNNPQVLAMLKLDNEWPESDEVPWCSGFVNYIAWLLRLPRSKSLLARSWLNVGRALSLDNTEVGNDIIILSRGKDSPGPENTTAPGHVGFFAGFEREHVLLLGGNQSNAVTVSRYPIKRLLGIRRLSA